MSSFRSGAAAAAFGLLCASVPAQTAAPTPPAAPAAGTDAATRAGLEELRATTLALIQALVDQGLLTQARADALIRQAGATPRTGNAAAEPQWGRPPTTVAAAPGSTVRVPYMSETTRNQIKGEVRDEVLVAVRNDAGLVSPQAADWLKRITIEGDVRWRVQNENYDENNLPAEIYRAQTDSPAWSPDMTNTTHDRDRQTLRARIGLLAQVSDSTSAGIRLTTGNGPVSGSQTMGNSYNRFTASIDRAWLRWSPLPGVTVDAGRIVNPMFSTDLLWPDDLSPDGVSLRLERALGSQFGVFATAMVSPLQEFSKGGSDKWLYAYQLGADWKGERGGVRLGVALYDWKNVEGVRETELPQVGPVAGTVDYQSSQYPADIRQKGNTLINLNAPGSTAAPVWGLASKFKPLDVTLAAAWRPVGGYEGTFSMDYVRNGAFDLADIERRAGTTTVSDLAEKTTGYQARFGFGTQTLARGGDWNVNAAYRMFERDAWVDSYTDTTWNVGGTNYKGYQIVGSYALDVRTILALRWTSTQNLDDGKRYLATPGDPSSISGNLSSAPFKVDVFQFEANVRF